LRREFADEIRQGRLGDTDQFITVDTAVMFQALVYTDEYLSRKTVVDGINGSTDDGGKARVYQYLATDNYKDPRFLGVSRGWMSNSIEFAAFHQTT
jgi:hypothetical protein